MWFCFAELARHGAEDASKQLARFSAALYLHRAVCRIVPDRRRPHLRPYMSGQQKKGGNFYPIFPAQWHCSGKLLGLFIYFFCMREIKVVGLFPPLVIWIKATLFPRTLDRTATLKQKHTRHLIFKDRKINNFSLKILQTRRMGVSGIRKWSNKWRDKNKNFQEVGSGYCSVSSSKGLAKIQLAADCLCRAQMD